jgi:DNA ligase (NAD+)
MSFEIDGAVVKLNSLTEEKALGARQIPAQGCGLQISAGEKAVAHSGDPGAGGQDWRPHAEGGVEPVRLAGTTVTNASLHNQ